MKRLAEQAIFTIFFSCLAGLGFTAGALFLFGVARLFTMGTV